jgi:hypothetical protein
MNCTVSNMAAERNVDSCPVNLASTEPVVNVFRKSRTLHQFYVHGSVHLVNVYVQFKV